MSFAKIQNAIATSSSAEAFSQIRRIVSAQDRANLDVIAETQGTAMACNFASRQAEARQGGRRPARKSKRLPEITEVQMRERFAEIQVGDRFVFEGEVIVVRVKDANSVGFYHDAGFRRVWR